MRSWDEPKKRKARVEIIPMIDVMMFLLVFFVLISLNVIPALGLKTQLPRSSTAQDLKPQTKAIITIAKDDVIQVDGDNTTLDALTARLDKLRKGDEKLNLIINSDRGVEVQRLVDVMDTLKKGGFDSISIATRKP
ncbi:ExbD/TolR family protein [Herbaspirillum huttiense]|uniref:ExbD/TolR family protein n=1 Tax=Herbaspirillum huttiense TaxID=863372 RepID=UPI0039B0D107